LRNNVSAREFIGRLKGATNGRIEEHYIAGSHVFWLIVNKPEKAVGIFQAPEAEAFEYDLAWYSAFVQEVHRLVAMPVEERQKAKVRVRLPYIEGLDRKLEVVDDQADAASGEGLERAPERLHPQRPYWLG
jgi:hypothetical protein